MTVREATIKANGGCVHVRHPKKDGFLYFRVSSKGVAKGKIVYDDTTLEQLASKTKMPKWVEQMLDNEVDKEDEVIYQKYVVELWKD